MNSIHTPGSNNSAVTFSAESLTALQRSELFSRRHIGPNPCDIDEMLDFLGKKTLQKLIAATVPASILHDAPLALAPALTEVRALEKLRGIMDQNKNVRSFIGLGYYQTHTPNVILRNVLENPGWYTAYTPYQAEISQGRLECLLNFQQMVLDLTSMELANASLLDEATAAAEAMALAKRVSKNKQSKLFFVDENCFPQTIDVLKTRARCFDYELHIGAIEQLADLDVFGAIFQYPDSTGDVRDFSNIIETLHEQKAIAIFAADLLALTVLKTPGEMGADVVVGSCQRFGVPIGFGGPHAAYFATKDEYKRAVPGRIIGVTKDARGKRSLRMAMQTREQHIRRDKANSNICTAQVLLANISALYAMYHGPKGLRSIARRVHRMTQILVKHCMYNGLNILNDSFFDTFTMQFDADDFDAVLQRSKEYAVNFRLHIDTLQIGVSLDESTSVADLALLSKVLLGEQGETLDIDNLDALSMAEGGMGFAQSLERQSDFLTHPHFNRYHSETEMLRLLKRLENKDISLCQSMIPLGSCTMKLNASAEMVPLTWSQISDPHPFAPAEQNLGYKTLIEDLEKMLIEITGYDAVSMQPNSGAQGEYAGLLAIRNYLEGIGQGHRNICLIPSSAHGTNPASALMIGMKVVVVACDENGNIDQTDLEAKAQLHKDNLAALMITYPSTHGVFEEGVRRVCEIVHECGGQVYLDGANLNAMVGVARPGDIGADVSHVNLHKTFCIPHGGGGPGMGPIGVKAHLAPYLPGHAIVKMSPELEGNSAVSAAPWGSASILPISWMYIAMMGPQGLLEATQVAILNANYIAKKLSCAYQVLYRGRNGMVAHECIIDIRNIKAATGISEEDLAKRLMDYGYHAPTMSFPVAGTLMIEPTESESKEEIDRFINAMLSIHEEIEQVSSGGLDAIASPLKNAPHTLADLVDEQWQRPYSKQVAVFPAPWLQEAKYWPTVNRVDNVYGDRNLICSCPPLEDYA